MDGKPVTHNGRVLGTDMDKLRQRAHAAAERLWNLAEQDGLLPKDRFHHDHGHAH